MEAGEFSASCIAISKVLYFRSDDELARFNRAKEAVLSRGEPGRRAEMMGKALARFKECYVHLYNMGLAEVAGHFSSMRVEAYGVIVAAIEALALANQTSYTRAWDRSMDEIDALRAKPEGLVPLLKRIIRERRPETIRHLCEELVTGTRRALVAEQRARVETRKHAEVFTGYLEEAKNWFNKMERACDEGDDVKVFFNAVRAQNEVGQMLACAEEGVEYSTAFNAYAELSSTYDRSGLPDWAAILDADNLKPMRDAVGDFEDGLKAHLVRNGVPMKWFKDIGQFEAYLEERFGK